MTLTLYFPVSTNFRFCFGKKNLRFSVFPVLSLFLLALSIRVRLPPFPSSTTSLFGAVCVGSDIDIRVLRGDGVAGVHTDRGQCVPVKTIDKDDPAHANIFTNFKHYKVPTPEVVRCCSSRSGLGCFRDIPTTESNGIYDAVVCDPPYGIRAGARMEGSNRANRTPIPDHKRDTHIPQTQPYVTLNIKYNIQCSEIFTH